MMKKSSISVASMALAFSLISSTAMADMTASKSASTSAASEEAKTSADFQDLANIDVGLKTKIDAMLAKGVFEGVADKSFGIDQMMTRAQFAKVLTLVYGIKVDMSVKTSSFNDVSPDDAANSWAIPYIEAAKKAGLIEGVSDSAAGPAFVPSGNITIGQLATALVKGLGNKVDTSGSPWYTSAVKQAIAAKLLPENTDGAKLATRADLVFGAYEGQQAYAEAHKPGPVSITSVKAIGVKTVLVDLDREVDTSKATLTLKKGSIDAATKIAWSDDKKTATLTLTDSALRAGEYQVTLGGIEAAGIKTATGTFTAEDEKLQKIEFANTGDTISLFENASVLVKATNQYGENASFSAGLYSVILSNGQTAQIVRRDDGLLKLTFDSSKDSNGSASMSNVSVISIHIYFNDTHLSASKNFTVGVAPFITKMSSGNVKYTNGSSLSQKGETATVPLQVYDQYGNELGFKAIQTILGATSNNDLATAGKAQIVVSPFESNLKAGLQDYDNTDTPEIRLNLNENIDKAGEYTTNVYLQAAAAGIKISVGSKSISAKVEIGEPDGGVIAAGDADVYIPIIAYDASGNKLSVEDLISDVNVNRIKIGVSGASVLNSDDSTGSSAMIWSYGPHRGSIRLSQVTALNGSMVTVNAFINSANVSSSTTKSFKVASVRVPDHLKYDVLAGYVPAQKIVAGGYTKFRFIAVDQYGKEFDTSGSFLAADGLGNPVNVADINNVTGVVYYKFKLTPINMDGVTVAITKHLDSAVAPNALVPYITSGKEYNTFAYVNGNSGYAGNTGFRELGNVYRVATSANATSKASGFKVDFIKVNSNGSESVVYTMNRDITIIDANSISNESLTYKATIPWNMPNYSLFATGDAIENNALIPNDDPDFNKLPFEEFKLSISDMQKPTSNLGQEVYLYATDAAGNQVALPKQISSVVSSNSSVVQAVYSPGGKAYIIGGKAGTASITVVYKTITGNDVLTKASVMVRSDPVAPVFMGANNEKTTTSLSGLNAFSLMYIYDNYGHKLYGFASGGPVRQYNNLFGIQFSVDHISGGTVGINQYGNVTATTDGTRKDSNGAAYVTYQLTAIAANGKKLIMIVIQK
ncbi:S-layer homology domain-containing protein [Paenibacillus sp. GCM10027628]|uniref:S-layer homology domain-containing protein n=1 Tax=Paenibacillus sp. GCM10027628 TaxID=3273413 RepID=UPI00363A3371